MRGMALVVLAVAVTFSELACSGSKAAGAAALVAWGMIGSAVSRSEGGCYAICEGVGQVCNTETGFCESNPCGAGCGDGRHCDIWGPVPRCVNDSMPADLVQIPTLPPPLPISAPTQ